MVSWREQQHAGGKVRREKETIENRHTTGEREGGLTEGCFSPFSKAEATGGKARQAPKAPGGRSGDAERHTWSNREKGDIGDHHDLLSLMAADHKSSRELASPRRGEGGATLGAAPTSSRKASIMAQKVLESLR